MGGKIAQGIQDLRIKSQVFPSGEDIFVRYRIKGGKKQHFIGIEGDDCTVFYTLTYLMVCNMKHQH